MHCWYAYGLNKHTWAGNIPHCVFILETDGFKAWKCVLMQVLPAMEGLDDEEGKT